MKQISYIFLLSLLVVLSSCTNARWIVKNKAAVDKTDYEVLQQHQFLQVSGEVAPGDPVLRLDVLSRTKYEYTQKVLMQRNIQDYRLRPGFVALGLTGAAMAFWAANSTVIKGNSTSAKSMTLNAAGALLAVSGFLNMKPVGEPRPTGEERYLRKTGTAVQIDTVSAAPGTHTVSVEMNYKGELIFEESRDFQTNQLAIPLADKLADLQIEGSNPGDVFVEVEYLDSSYTFVYPVDRILQPYARVSSQFTELRNSPDINPNNIVSDLLKGSQVKIQNYDDEQWYRVLYGGITENYIFKDDAELVWEPSDFAQNNSVVVVPRIPFGNIDVESNIPVLQASNPNAVALIVTNENYSGRWPENSYAHRDGKLIETYLQNALGFNSRRIFTLNDVTDSDQLNRTLSHIRFSATDSTEFFIYLSGYGSVDSVEENVSLKILTVQREGERGTAADIDLKRLLNQISTVPSSQTLILSDLDFSHNIGANSFTPNERQQILESLVSNLLERDSNAALLMGAQPGQPSSLYFSKEGEDKKHHIFPYFFAKAIQQRYTSLASIYQFLERNVSYTSRRLHDRPQDPMLLGDVMLDLVEEQN